MAERPVTTAPAAPEHERRPARRVATPFILAIAVVALVIGIVFAAVRPWEGSETAQRDTPPIASPTATR